jgi:hypothetical protein
MVIYNGYISLETSHIEDTLAKIRTRAENYGGYVVGSLRSTYGMQATAEKVLPRTSVDRASRICSQEIPSEDVFASRPIPSSQGSL